MLELLELIALFLCKGGWGLFNKSCYPSTAAYESAKSRLRKQGLIVNATTGAGTPQLLLTDQAKDHMPDYFYPERFWNRKWNKIWYMMIYDVPEKDRKYRNVLRQFLKRKRMGCLQKSVWITPQDIRPDFADLAATAAIETFAYLFESHSVLGMPASHIVSDAWAMGSVHEIQEHFCITAENNIALLGQDSYSIAQLTELLKLTTAAFHSAMHNDPLLPHALLPDNYLGKEVFALQKSLMESIDKQPALSHPD